VWHKSGDIEQAGLVAAVEQAAAGIVITDVHGTIQYANPAFTALTGYSCAEAVGQNPRFLKSGETPAALYEELWSTIRSGRVWHGELMNRRKNGTMYCEEMQITPVEGSPGQILSYIAIKRDVTQLRAEIQAQNFLATIVQSCDDAIIAYSPSGVGGGEKGYQFSGREGARCRVTLWPAVGRRKREEADCFLSQAGLSSLLTSGVR
jgi:PAS domain S-box-containing protein